MNGIMRRETQTRQMINIITEERITKLKLSIISKILLLQNRATAKESELGSSSIARKLSYKYVLIRVSFLYELRFEILFTC
jgi:hypothetical protein